MDKRKKMVTLLAAIMAGIMLLSLLLSLLVSVVSVANAASSDEIADQIEQLKDEYAKQEAAIAELEALLAENNKEIKNMVARKNGIDQQIAILSKQIITINQIISAHNLQIADKQDELDAAEAKLAALQEAYEDRIRVMEEQGDVSYWSVIFQANSFSDLLDRLNMVAEIAQSDRIRMQQIRDMAAQVEEARAELEQQKAELEASKQILLESQADLDNKNTEAEALLSALMILGGEYEVMVEAGQDVIESLWDQLQEKEEELEHAEYLEWLATSVPPTTTKFQGQYVNTVNGIVWYTPVTNFSVTSKFVNRHNPVTGKWEFHNGVDLGCPKNTPIVATRAGLVTFAGYQENGAGFYVWINHGDGFKSIYMHMTRYTVEEGQYVEAGEVIGYVGSTGLSTGNHLHFGIKYNNSYVDPLKYIKVS